MKITKLGLLYEAEKLMEQKGLRNNPVYLQLEAVLSEDEKALDVVGLHVDRGEITLTLRNENASPVLVFKLTVLNNNGMQDFVGIEEILIVRAPGEEISLKVTSEEVIV